MSSKFKHLPYKDAPHELRQLVDKLRQTGESLVLEDDAHNPIVCVALLEEEPPVRREAAAHRLREILDSVPLSSCSEEETYALVDEAIAAVRKELREQPTR